MDARPALPEAPGAKASRHCGVWALVLVIIFFPAAVVLGIIAIVKNNKARALARQAPESYSPPSSAGMIMGIIALAAIPAFLFFVGILAAIAIPAFLGQANRARDRVVLSNLSVGTKVLVNQYEMGTIQGKADLEIHKDLEAQLRETGAPLKNPWNVTGPAFNYSISVVNGLDEEGVKEAAAGRAKALGQPAFIVQFPSRGGQPVARPGFIAGAVQTKMPIAGADITTRVVPLN